MAVGEPFAVSLLSFLFLVIIFFSLTIWFPVSLLPLPFPNISPDIDISLCLSEGDYYFNFFYGIYYYWLLF